MKSSNSLYESLLPVVLYHSWQGSHAPNISYSQLRCLYPEIDTYLEHWLSFEFWSSVLDGVLAFSRLVGAFDWDWQKTLEDCKQKDQSNRLIAIIKELLFSHYRRLGRIQYIHLSEDILQGEKHFGYAKCFEEGPNTYFTFGHRSFVDEKNRRLYPLKIALHETRHAIQKVSSLPLSFINDRERELSEKKKIGKGLDIPSEIVYDLSPQEIDACLYQESVSYLLNAYGNLALNPRWFDAIRCLQSALQNAIIDLTDSVANDIEALRLFLDSQLEHPLYGIFATLLIQRILVLERFYIVRTNVVVHGSTPRQSVEYERELNSLRDYHTDYRLVAAIHEYIGYVRNRRASNLSLQESKEIHYSEAVRNHLMALRYSEDSRHLKYVAQNLMELAQARRDIKLENFGWDVFFTYTHTHLAVITRSLWKFLREVQSPLLNSDGCIPIQDVWRERLFLIPEPDKRFEPQVYADNLRLKVKRQGLLVDIFASTLREVHRIPHDIRQANVGVKQYLDDWVLERSDEFYSVNLINDACFWFFVTQAWIEISLNQELSSYHVGTLGSYLMGRLRFDRGDLVNLLQSLKDYGIVTSATIT